MLNTQHLITFKALVQTGSFTKTAKQLGLTQPAVSQHIQKLERDLGEALLLRHGRTTEMTPAGRILLQHIQELEVCYNDFIASWQNYLENQFADETETAKHA
ncbi:regulatory helix-turn-helix LysR family protein [Marinomonas alcarazii]|uniref:Regulatory helix-turn-helix LysR family protein n=1 Tax=Marinomonas alcarazii TaxID=491949 RepID=A0A318V3G1_9GAMM|nr:LysR family transcriptional regulator [Marinomonas alcarazii]PYF83124.1 regulatory helix-turn-helix LysR family protein [Marinomonas alcarazii]